jgi:hypothetical protein
MLKYIILLSILVSLLSDSIASNLNYKTVTPDSTFDVVNFYSIKNFDTTFFRKINNDVATISFNAKLNKKDNIFFPVKEITIRDSSSNQLIQIIDPEKDSLGIVNIEFNDFNFDGYIDLYVYDGCAILGNCFGKVYLYNNDLKKFVREYAFDNMTSVQVDKDKKTIRSFNQCCAGSESETKIYKYYDGKLTLIKEISKNYNNKNSKFIYKIKEYGKNGKLIKSKKVISDDFDLDLE